jgi:hypothetical protein
MKKRPFICVYDPNASWAGDRLAVVYVGRLAATGVEFDRTADLHRPFHFVLGEGSVIEGWEKGVAAMGLGERSQLRIPAAMGYGDFGSGTRIPPDADLVFDLHVVCINHKCVTPSAMNHPLLSVFADPKSAQRPSRYPANDAAGTVAMQRREAVRREFLHAWDGYAHHAWGHDEVRPVSNATNDSWGGFAATLVDGLDTLMLIDGVASPRVRRAREFVATLQWDKDYTVSFFETIIRYVGGLLGAYELSRDQLYLNQAKGLADRLMPSFQSTKSGLPRSLINLKTGRATNHKWASSHSILAEVGSCQLEFAYLSHHLGDAAYGDAARVVFTQLNVMEAREELHGLWPTLIESDAPHVSPVNTHVTLGSLADSFFEYLLKHYLLTKDSQSLEMYLKATAGMIFKC